MLLLIRRRPWIVLFAFVSLLWLLEFTVGAAICRAVAGRFGEPIIRLSHGKFNDAATFLFGRGHDFLLLLTAAAAGAWLAVLGGNFLASLRAFRNAEGLVKGLVLFVAVNGWVRLAMQTELFWLPFYSSSSIDNFVQYQVKKHLLPEIRANQRAVLLGNSQSRACIKEETLNDLLAPELWTTELHQPGCNGFGTYLVAEDLRNEPINLSLTYISEIFVYGRENGATVPEFLRLSDLPAVQAMQGWPWISAAGLKMGLFGDLIPLVRLRDAISRRALGGDLADLPQAQYDGGRSSSLEQQAEDFGGAIRCSPVAAFQKHGFEKALDLFAQRGCRNLIVFGGVHPALRRRVDPAVLMDLTAWLNEIAQRPKACATIVREEVFFKGTAGDYEDLVHLNETAQDRFSKGLAGWLKENGFAGPAAR